MFVDLKIGNKSRNLKPGFYRLIHFDKENQLLHLEETTTKRKMSITPGCLDMILHQRLGDITAVDPNALRGEKCPGSLGPGENLLASEH